MPGCGQDDTTATVVEEPPITITVGPKPPAAKVCESASTGALTFEVTTKPAPTGIPTAQLLGAGNNFTCDVTAAATLTDGKSWNVTCSGLPAGKYALEVAANGADPPGCTYAMTVADAGDVEKEFKPTITDVDAPQSATVCPAAAAFGPRDHTFSVLVNTTHAKGLKLNVTESVCNVSGSAAESAWTVTCSNVQAPGLTVGFEAVAGEWEGDGVLALNA